MVHNQKLRASGIRSEPRILQTSQGRFCSVNHALVGWLLISDLLSSVADFVSAQRSVPGLSHFVPLFTLP